MVGEREGPAGQGSGEMVFWENLFVGPETPTLHSFPSCLRTETTSRDKMERVQLSYTTGSGVGVSPKPPAPWTPSPAPARVETVAAAARLS